MCSLSLFSFYFSFPLCCLQDAHTERQYIRAIVDAALAEGAARSDADLLTGSSTQLASILTSLFAACQNFLRRRNDETSFVNLRDVLRGLTVFRFFMRHMAHFTAVRADVDSAEVKRLREDLSRFPRDILSVVLSLALCYRCRLSPQARLDFDASLHAALRVNGVEVIRSPDDLRNIIHWMQMLFARHLRVSATVALNAALVENTYERRKEQLRQEEERGIESK